MNTRIPLLLILVLLTLVCCFNSPAGVKVAIVGGRSYQLGILDEGSIANRNFLMWNSGTDTLHVYSVGTSCGCTVARPGSKTVPPGDTTSIVVTFNTSGFDGPVRKQVFVRTDAPGEDSLVTITMDATVRAIIAIKPNFIDFNKTPRGKSVTRPLMVTNNSDKTVTIKSITCVDSLISFQSTPITIKPHTSTNISTTYNVTRRGHYINQFTIKTDYPGKEEMKVTYIGDGL